METRKNVILYAHVSYAEVRARRLNAVIRRWRALLVAEREIPGFRGAFLLVDSVQRIGMAISLSESQDRVEQIVRRRESVAQISGELAGPPEIAAYRVPVRTMRIEPARYARATWADIRGSQEVESQLIWEAAQPAYGHVGGFSGALMLEALHSARGLVITFWESEEAARRQSESGMRTEVLSRFDEAMVSPPIAKGFEVVLQI